LHRHAIGSVHSLLCRKRIAAGDEHDRLRCIGGHRAESINARRGVIVETELIRAAGLKLGQLNAMDRAVEVAQMDWLSGVISGIRSWSVAGSAVRG
jgi:hypothetical protein